MTPTDTRCPDCGSLVRAGMSWCTLCHADLRSEQEKESARLEPSLLLVASGASTSSGSDGPADDRTAAPSGSPADAVPGASGAPPGRGRHARPSAAQVVTLPPALVGGPGPAPEGADPEQSAETLAAAAAAESEAKLAELRQAGIDVDGMLAMLAADKGSDPLTGFVKERLGSKGSRAVAILVASAALTSSGILLMFVLGSVFG